MDPIPILSGVYATSEGDFYASYPTNLEPQLVDSGLSKGYLRSAAGIVQTATGPGADRGAINWLGTQYRTMGGKLVSVSGATVTNLGNIAGSEPTAMDYSFDLLGVLAGQALSYWDGGALNPVTDPDLGLPIDMLWIDGYFMMTDGQYLIVTELNDPYSIDPLKYGSSEEDPDPITGLMKVRGEVYALNRYTIENFQNIGGSGFPFTRNNGGLISKGCVGPRAKSYISQSFAFVGSGRNEQPSVYLAGAGTAIPISTPQIDQELSQLSETELAAIQMETRVEQNQERLLVHLPTKTLVYAGRISSEAQEPIWYYLAGGADASEPYPLQHLCLQDGVFYGGDQSGRIAKLDSSVQTYFGEIVGWSFDTMLLWNSAKGGIIKSLELIGLPGRGPFGMEPTCFLSITFDGQTYGQERAISMGNFGQRGKRLQWRPKIHFWNYVGLRFRGANAGVGSFAALQPDIEPLAA